MVVAGYIWKITEMCHRTFRSYLTIVSMEGVGVQNWRFCFVLNAFVENDLPAKLQNARKYAYKRSTLLVHFLQRLEIQVPKEEPPSGLSRCSLLNY